MSQLSRIKTGRYIASVEIKLLMRLIQGFTPRIWRVYYILLIRHDIMRQGAEYVHHLYAE